VVAQAESFMFDYGTNIILVFGSRCAIKINICQANRALDNLSACLLLLAIAIKYASLRGMIPHSISHSKMLRAKALCSFTFQSLPQHSRMKRGSKSEQ
jgi:hypothetical protein